METPPVTERVLARLGRPRLLWVVVWSLVALITPPVFFNALRVSGYPAAPSDQIQGVTSQGVLAFACLVLLLGTGALSRQALVARASLAGFVASEVQAGLFRGIGSLRGP